MYDEYSDDDDDYSDYDDDDDDSGYIEVYVKECKDRYLVTIITTQTLSTKSLIIYTLIIL